MQLKTILVLLTFLMMLSNLLIAQQSIRITYHSTEKLTNAAAEAIIVSGYKPVHSIDAFTLVIDTENNTSVFKLDSIKFDELEELEFRKYLCEELSRKEYNTKSFFYRECSFEENKCFTGEIDYIKKVKVNRERLKKILGLPCFYFTYEIGQVQYEGWFTEDLPFTDGPFGLNNSHKVNIPLVPGIVLYWRNKSTGSYFGATDIQIDLYNTTDQFHCETLKDISTFNKMEYYELKKQKAIKLVAEEIILGKWYHAKK